MNAFPLLRTKLSNERLMAALLFVLALYQLPRWVSNPVEIGGFLALLAFSLAVDTAVNFIRYKRPMCAVSAGVTAALLYALSPGVPLWGQLIAAAIALLAGKHVWGGTGKNPINPAMVGLLLLGLAFPIQFPPLAPSWLLLPAMLLSLPFLFFRPYASVGMMAGMLAALLLHGTLTFANELSYGVVLWGCLVITDPVTTTARPLPGAVAGVLAGLVPLMVGGSASAMALGVLAANVLSLAADRLGIGAGPKLLLKFGSRMRIPFSREGTAFVDLTEGVAPEGGSDVELTSVEILERIERCGVFGYGGAAFPTARKIRTAIAADTAEKHLIVNGAECDPGLIHDKWLLRHHADEIIGGIGLLCRCIPFATVTVACKDIDGLAFPSPVRLHRVPDYYPAGAEKALIREVLKNSVAEGEIPAEKGILVLNVQTVFSIYEAVRLNRMADTRFITVADAGRRTGTVARVRLGAGAHSVVEGVFPCTAVVFTGGGMMNAQIASDDAVVDKAVNFLAAGKLPDYRESPLCSRCGLCSAVCPARLHVQEIAGLVDEGHMERTAQFRPEMCMACGSCSHVCLAGRNLSAKVSVAREHCKGSASALQSAKGTL
jgi:ferredoxin